MTQFAACIPARAMVAKLSSDRSTCTFADGLVMRFEQVLPVGGPASGPFAFDAGSCRFFGEMASDGRFTGNIGDSFSISSQTESSITIYPNPSYELACANVRYATSPQTVDTWPAQIVPNFTLSIDATGVAFTLDSVAASGPLFTCAP